MTTVHIEGMGVVGSLLAHWLNARGQAFTWNDVPVPFTAWQASTGCIYPDGDPVSAGAYKQWHDWVQPGQLFDPWVEESTWCYISKRPPQQGHKLGVQEVDRVGPIRVSGIGAYHFNAQNFVPATRRLFALHEDKEPDKRTFTIVTHGTARAARYTWGWHKVVEADFSSEMKRALRLQDPDSFRPAIDLRAGYDMVYLYPWPGARGMYYLGTSTVSQTTPKKADKSRLVERYRTVATAVEKRTEGHVVVRQTAGPITQGWRPVPPKNMEVIDRDGPRRVFVRPMQGSGFRHFPLVAQALASYLP